MITCLWYGCVILAEVLPLVKCVGTHSRSAAFLPISSVIHSQRSKTDHLSLCAYSKTYSNVALHTVRGGQYFLPEEQLEQRRLQEEWHSVAQVFGFAEYSLGVLAHAELYGSQSSTKNEHRNELYTLVDRKGRHLALRGDVTPQFMSMLKSHREGVTNGAGKFTLPPSHVTKWYTLADCWRYERPAHCRRRNHLQWTCDIVGIQEETAEVELLVMLIHFFRKYQLTNKDLAIHLNHHDSTTAILELLGRPTNNSQWVYQFRKAMDKYRKLPKDTLSSFFVDLGLTEADIERLFHIIESCVTISDLEETFSPEAKFVKNLRSIVEGLETFGHKGWVRIDLSIVRGNDYYNGAVFECFDQLNRGRRAIAGGGRYDNYFGAAGAYDKQLSYAVGFGMGNVAIIELLRDRGIRENGNYADVVVFTPPPTADKALDLVHLQSINTMVDSLRRDGLKVYQYYKTPKYHKALEFAEKIGCSSFLRPQTEGHTLIYQVHDLSRNVKVNFPQEDREKVLETLRAAKDGQPHQRA